MTTADLNGDGDQDVILYGGADTQILHGSSEYDFHNATADVLGELTNISDVSSVSPFDYDNDGDLDLLITRAKPQFKQQRFYDEATNRFAFFTFIKSQSYPDFTIEGNFEIENLQQAYPDFDLFLGAEKTKFEFNVERHGHKDISIQPSDATGWPENLKERGMYIGYLGNSTWRLHINNRSRTAGVIKNVLGVIETPQLEPLPVKLLQNQDGVFTDVTKEMKLEVNEQTTSSVTADFNNDGWVDLFIVKYGNMATDTQQLMYLNRQGKGFELQQAHGVVSNEIGATGSGAEAFDFDSDGDVDIVYGNERGLWHLFENKLRQTDKENSLTVFVGQSPKQAAPFVQAKVTVESCGLSQTKYLGNSSAPYSQNSDQHLHFGLGDCTQARRVTTNWSNGEQETKSIEANMRKTKAGK